MKGASITLNTWGTDVNRQTGVAHVFDNAFFGGNCGHASLSMTIPVTPEGTALMKKYCFNDKGERIIPFEKTTMNIMDEEGRVTEQEVYSLYFSWWDQRVDRYGQNKGLIQNINEDNLLERPGTPILGKPKYPELLEKREFRGLLGKRAILQAPYQIIHPRKGLSEEQTRLLELERKLIKLSNEQEKVNALYGKLEKDKVIITPSMLKYIKEEVQDIELSSKQRMLTPEQKVQLEEKLKQQRKSVNSEIKKTRQEIRKIKNPVRSKLSLKNVNISSIEAFSKLCAQEGEDVLEFERRKLEILFKIKNNFLPRPKIEGENPDDHMARVENEIKSLNQAIDDTLLKIRDLQGPQSLDEMKSADPFSMGHYQQNVSLGYSPDNQIHLKVGSLQENARNADKGMNVESMLKKMHEFALMDGKDFDMFKKNCSTTVGAILEAGAEPEWKRHFNAKALGAFGTPQEVLIKTMEYDHAIRTREGKQTSRDKVMNNPLYHWANSTVGGAFNNGIYELMYGETNAIKARALGKLLLTTPLVLTGITVRAILNPLKTVNNCFTFIDYANKSNSPFLKEIGIRAAMFVVTVFALPAAAQFGIQKGMVEPIQKWRFRRKLSQSKKIKEKSTKPTRKKSDEWKKTTPRIQENQGASRKKEIKFSAHRTSQPREESSQAKNLGRENTQSNKKRNQ